MQPPISLLMLGKATLTMTASRAITKNTSVHATRVVVARLGVGAGGIRGKLDQGRLLRLAAAPLGLLPRATGLSRTRCGGGRRSADPHVRRLGVRVLAGVEDGHVSVRVEVGPRPVCVEVGPRDSGVDLRHLHHLGHLDDLDLVVGGSS